MSPRSGWLLVHEIIPRLPSSIPGSVLLAGSDDAAELLQDGTAIAAQLLHSAEARGKHVSAGNIAYFAVKYLKIGRRSTGYWKSNTMHPSAQLSGRSRVHSFEEPLTFTEPGDEPVTLGEALASRNDDPSVEAARRMDWDEFEQKLDAVAKAILNALIAGQELTTLVLRLGKSRSALQGHKDRLAVLIREEFGPDILALARERAGWRNTLEPAFGHLDSRQAARGREEGAKCDAGTIDPRACDRFAGLFGHHMQDQGGRMLWRGPRGQGLKRGGFDRIARARNVRSRASGPPPPRPSDPPPAGLIGPRVPAAMRARPRPNPG